MIWADKAKGLEQEIGWFLLGINGFMIGLHPASFWICKGSPVRAIFSLVICVCAMPLACKMSNDWKFKLPGLFVFKEVKLWGGRDPWWVSEFTMGLVLGLCYII